MTTIRNTQPQMTTGRTLTPPPSTRTRGYTDSTDRVRLRRPTDRLSYTRFGLSPRLTGGR